MTSQGFCTISYIAATHLIGVQDFHLHESRMKTFAIRFAFFLAFFLLKMRNALPTNGLEDFKRGQAVSPGHLPLFHEIAHRARANLRKQTPSNMEDMSDSNVRSHYEATLFHSIVSRSTNPRKFPKEPFKVRDFATARSISFIY